MFAQLCKGHRIQQSGNLIHKEGGMKNHGYVVKYIKSLLLTYKIPKITWLLYFIPI
jgi:hypothetical protein